MTEANLVKRTVIFAAVALVLIGAVACTREKPPIVEPTPTLIVLGTPRSTSSDGVAGPTTPITVTEATAIAQETPSASESPQATTVPIGSGTSVSYTVQWGDLLNKIATRYGVTSQAIIAANPGLDPNKIYPGQVIVIPAAGSTPVPTASTTGSTTTAATTYTVQRGDWFYSIARKFGLTTQALQAANPGVNPSVVYPGQVLNIPGGAKPDAAATPSGKTSSYVVQSGDTLTSIAVKLGKTVYELQIANNLPSPNSIYPGQTLIVP